MGDDGGSGVVWREEGSSEGGGVRVRVGWRRQQEAAGGSKKKKEKRL